VFTAPVIFLLSAFIDVQSYRYLMPVPEHWRSCSRRIWRFRWSRVAGVVSLAMALTFRLEQRAWYRQFRIHVGRHH
jgi:hypothetical protein